MDAQQNETALEIVSTQTRQQKRNRARKTWHRKNKSTDKYGLKSHIHDIKTETTSTTQTTATNSTTQTDQIPYVLPAKPVIELGHCRSLLMLKNANPEAGIRRYAAISELEELKFKRNDALYHCNDTQVLTATFPPSLKLLPNHKAKNIGKFKKHPKRVEAKTIPQIDETHSDEIYKTLFSSRKMYKLKNRLLVPRSVKK